VAISDGTAEIMLLSRDGRAIRFPEEDVPVQGRTAQGVKGIDLRDDDHVVGVLMVRREASVLTVTEDGAGKRTPVSDFPLQKRGGLGTLAVPSSGKVVPLVAALEVVEADEVMLVTAGGQVSAVRVERAPLQGRRTQGKRLVKVASGDRVVEVTRSAGGTPERSETPEPVESGAGDSDGDGRGQLDLLGE
jgi:DNA gyrase subunit A